MSSPTTTIPNPTTAVVDAHLRAYGEPDPQVRAALIAETWADDGVLVDPPLDPAAGPEGLDATFAAVQALYPGHTFRRVTGVDRHHEVGRYGWEMIDADAAVVLAGTDVVDFAPDGRLTRVVGFFGDLPAVE